MNVKLYKKARIGILAGDKNERGRIKCWDFQTANRKGLNCCGQTLHLHLILQSKM